MLIGIAFSWIGHEHESALDCLYADKDCSLAVGTWVLADVTLAAFTAAAVAAFYAANAYGLEVNAVLGHKICTQRHRDRQPDVTLYVTSARSAPRRFEPVGPTAKFTAEHHAFLNLGRTPLTDVAVTYSLQVDGRNGPFNGEVFLDCIPVDGEAHFTLYVRQGLGAKISWKKPARQGEVPLKFFPGRAFTFAGTRLPRTPRARPNQA